jgi:hypothetical protein
MAFFKYTLSLSMLAQPRRCVAEVVLNSVPTLSVPPFPMAHGQIGVAGLRSEERESISEARLKGPTRTPEIERRPKCTGETSRIEGLAKCLCEPLQIERFVVISCQLTGPLRSGSAPSQRRRPRPIHMPQT